MNCKQYVWPGSKCQIWILQEDHVKCASTGNLFASNAFYKAASAVNNPAFTDGTTTCMVLFETIQVMLLTHNKRRSFTSKPIVEAHANAQELLCLSADRRHD